jgi:hypothetical protein
MARQEITACEFTCAYCKKSERTANRHTLPPGWTESASVPFPGVYQQSIDLCPVCSENPMKAAKRAKQKWSVMS